MKESENRRPSTPYPRSSCENEENDSVDSFQGESLVEEDDYGSSNSADEDDFLRWVASLVVIG